MGKRNVYPEVKVGQQWVDIARRTRRIVEVVAISTASNFALVKVIYHANPEVLARADAGGRRTKVRLTRFRPKYFRLLGDGIIPSQPLPPNLKVQLSSDKEHLS